MSKKDEVYYIDLHRIWDDMSRLIVERGISKDEAIEIVCRSGLPEISSKELAKQVRRRT